MENQIRIQLTSLRAENVSEIKRWPAYQNEFEQMDYALRDKGWIDEFWGRSESLLYAAKLNGELIGFSLLNRNSSNEAEFRIAIHPLSVGKRLGREITSAMLIKGFEELQLKRITLIVRKNNFRAFCLYERNGFSKTGESIHMIQGKRIEFFNMAMSRDKFNQMKIKEHLLQTPI
jgi:diamine N-acetyltransferase